MSVPRRRTGIPLAICGTAGCQRARTGRSRTRLPVAFAAFVLKSGRELSGIPLGARHLDLGLPGPALEENGRVRRLVLWSGLDAWRAEVVSMELGVDGIVAAGTQIGSDPVAYRLDYRLKAGPAFITQSMTIDVAGESWARQMRLVRHVDGTWSCDRNEYGEAPLPAARGDVAAVSGALDCDLARSPLTNLMPVRRHRLHERPGQADFLMAWVSLGLHPSEQHYEHVRRDDNHAVVRYVGRHRDFVGDLVFDRDGVVELYPDLASRVTAP